LLVVCIPFVDNPNRLVLDSSGFDPEGFASIIIYINSIIELYEVDIK
jgi:hypothetical protein